MQMLIFIQECQVTLYMCVINTETYQRSKVFQ